MTAAKRQKLGTCLTAEWIDNGRAPQCAPNPAFPNGIDVDVSDGASKTCSIDLPYPAPRCGAYVIRCDRCQLVTAITTAGRPDDPRNVTLACFAQMIDPHRGLTEIVLPDTRKMKGTPHT